MKQSFIQRLVVVSVLALAALPSPAIAQSGATPAFGAANGPSIPGAHPLLSFPTTVVSGGIIRDDAPMVVTFSFTNISDKPVRLAIMGCEFCGLPTSDKAEYAPGEAGTILMTLDPIGKRGEIQTMGGIGVLDPRTNKVNSEGYVHLLAQAEVRPDVSIDPPTFVAPELIRSEVQPVTFTVTGRTLRVSGKDEPFRITETDTGSPHAKLSLSEPTTERIMGVEYTRYTATVTISKDIPVGPVSIPIRMATTNPQSPVLGYPINTTVLGELRGEPDVAVVGNVEPRAPFVGVFTIRPRVIGEPVVIKAVDVVSRGHATSVVVDAVPQAGAASWRVQVSGLAAARILLHDDVQVSVTASIAGGPDETIVVPVRMSVRMK